MGLLLVLDVDADLAGHLAVAVHRHRDVLDHAGRACPDGLDELEQLLATAATRQDAPQAASRNGHAYGVGMDHEREWLTRTDVARMTGVSERTVDRWCADSLRSAKVGRARRVSAST